MSFYEKWTSAIPNHHLVFGVEWAVLKIFMAAARKWALHVTWQGFSTLSHVYSFYSKHRLLTSLKALSRFGLFHRPDFAECLSCHTAEQKATGIVHWPLEDIYRFIRVTGTEFKSRSACLYYIMHPTFIFVFVDAIGRWKAAREVNFVLWVLAVS